MSVQMAADSCGVGDDDVVVKTASELTFQDVGMHLHWTVPDPAALIDRQTMWRELGWVGFDGYGVQVGLYPDDDDDQFEDYYLEAGTPIELTIMPIPGTVIDQPTTEEDTSHG